MSQPSSDAPFRQLPSVDALLNRPELASALADFGRASSVAALRASLERARKTIAAGGPTPQTDDIIAEALSALARTQTPLVKSVFNLTGVVLHTNLGRAVLAEAAVEAATRAMRDAIALEFDLEQGKRGERDGLVRDLICELTGAEDATIVNNNAAAVLLMLNAVAAGKEAIISRGELIEIGGAFRMPDVMARAGVSLCEIGATNRTHLQDYVEAIGAETGALVRAHPSNFRIEGFTRTVADRDIAQAAHAAGLPFLNDLGSGVLIDLEEYGLQHEQTVREALAAGADLVSFSGDKLLGAAQAGFIVGRKDLIARINKNPLKRAMRIDKIRLAAIEATLRLYRDPERLAERLPTLRHLARQQGDIRAMAAHLAPAARAALPDYDIAIVDCDSQIGSGALPLHGLPSAGLAIRPRHRAQNIETLAFALRGAPKPIVGRIERGALILDLRCLDAPSDLATAFARFGGAP
jgi:L-seryl-tRNA(Ser) seleniumtransferase